MRIREAKKPEAEKITRELWLPLAKEMEKKSSYNELVDDINLEECIDHRREGIREPGKFTYIAEEGELKGFISAKIKDTPPIFTRGDKMKINELYVKNSFRRKGIASRLISQIEKEAEREDCGTIELSVDISNETAKKLYEKKDFETVRERMVKTL